MFMGVTAEGMNREVASTLECTLLCRENRCKSLAIPETAILKLASLIPPEIDPQHSPEEYIHEKTAFMDDEFRPSWKDIARGILPSLKHVVNKELNTANSKSTRNFRSNRKEIHPDSTFDSSRAPIDPFGNDYFCKLCDHELSNTYYHCDGCETLLSKDFNICSLCFEERKFLQDISMHDCRTLEIHSGKHHIGRPKLECSCDPAAPVCEHCRKGMTCCCNCHTIFSRRSRFFTLDDLARILLHTEQVVGDDSIEYAVETENRLDRVVMVPESPTAGQEEETVGESDQTGASIDRNGDQDQTANGAETSNVAVCASDNTPEVSSPRQEAVSSQQAQCVLDSGEVLQAAHALTEPVVGQSRDDTCAQLASLEPPAPQQSAGSDQLLTSEVSSSLSDSASKSELKSQPSNKPYLSNSTVSAELSPDRSRGSAVLDVAVSSPKGNDGRKYSVSVGDCEAL
jgi:hypothetical protein